MKVEKAELYLSIWNKRELPPPDCPEIALVGRSNVGKSSLINALLQRRRLAHTSNTPGKTRALHFYRVNDRFFIVDLPGYGYARASRSQQRAWSELVEAYLETRKNHALFLHLVDLRHAPSADDLRMAAWIRYYGSPYRVVATKADKLARGKSLKHQQLVASSLEVEAAGIILFSAISGEGKDVLWRAIQDEIANYPPGRRSSSTAE